MWVARGVPAVLLTLVVASAGRAAAQELPTLRGLGAAYASASGALQVSLSGRLDLETLDFTGDRAGLATGAGVLEAPRLRVFSDVFLGSAVYGLVELRADRGEAPTAGKWAARVEQAYLRASSHGGALSLQAGRFASPFGSYPMRHLTVLDPFVRPPLAYDYRTMACDAIAPASTADFLTWRDDPAKFRPKGSPPVWGVPYQWGAMVAGARAFLSYRFAAMNSAPSSPPAAWGFDVKRFEHPSFVGGVVARVSPALSLGTSWDRGPWLENLVQGTLDPGRTRWDYVQELFSADAAWARGPATIRAEVIRDRWQVPHVTGDPVEWSYAVEGQTDIRAGLSAAVRLSTLVFRPLSDASGTQEWDYDVLRYQASLAYRVARNAGVLGSLLVNDQRSPLDPRDDLLSLRLWWAF
jgi:hypothetical protein